MLNLIPHNILWQRWNAEKTFAEYIEVPDNTYWLALLIWRATLG